MRKIFFLFACCSILLPAQENISIDSTLKQIEALYNSAQYVPAELEARRLYEKVSFNDSVKVQCEKWIGFSLIAQGRSALARERFVSLLSIDPEFDLDPVLTSPKILSVFYEARTKYNSMQKNQPDSSADLAEPFQTITYRTLVFPGWEQMYQGRTTTGEIFLGAGVGTLGAGITFEILRAAARKSYLNATVPSDIESKYDTYNRYRKAEVYSFIAFAVVYFASEIEVLSNFQQSSVSFHSSKVGSGAVMATFSINL